MYLPGPVIFPLSSSHSHTDEADSKYNTSVKSHDLSASQKHTSSEMQDVSSSVNTLVNIGILYLFNSFAKRAYWTPELDEK